MKDPSFVCFGSPCSGCLAHPDVRSFGDAMQSASDLCPYLLDGQVPHCAATYQRCIRAAGARIARSVVQFFLEASEDALAREREFFRRRVFPVSARGRRVVYIDPDHGFARLTDPDEIVRRVWEYARAVLRLRPGERVRRPSGRYLPPPQDTPALLRRSSSVVPAPLAPRAAAINAGPFWLASPGRSVA